MFIVALLSLQWWSCKALHAYEIILQYCKIHLNFQRFGWQECYVQLEHNFWHATNPPPLSDSGGSNFLRHYFQTVFQTKEQ